MSRAVQAGLVGFVFLSACSAPRSTAAHEGSPATVHAPVHDAAGTTEPQPSRPATQARSPHGFRRNVAVLVFEGVELLDFAGPVETFTNTRRWDEPLRVYTVGAEKRALRTGNVVTIVPDWSVSDAPLPDILVIPGGEVGCLEGDTPLGRYIKEQAPRAEIVMSVCNGVFALADLGLLDGLEATTHHSAIGWLRDSAPLATVKENCRFTDNGHIVTAAGISAGIDGALHLVERLLGKGCARETARRMEYEWQHAPVGDDAPGSLVEHARHAWYEAEWSTAAEDYARLVARDPQDVVALERLGTALLFTKHTDAALVHLQEAVRLGSTDAWLFSALGFAYERLERRAESLAAYERSVALDPSRIEARRGLAHAQVAAGQHAEAAANLLLVIATGVGDADMYATLARSQSRSGDREGALRTLVTFAARFPDEIEALLADPVFDSVRNDPRLGVSSRSRERSP